MTTATITKKKKACLIPPKGLVRKAQKGKGVYILWNKNLFDWIEQQLNKGYRTYQIGQSLGLKDGGQISRKYKEYRQGSITQDYCRSTPKDSYYEKMFSKKQVVNKIKWEHHPIGYATPIMISKLTQGDCRFPFTYDNKETTYCGLPITARKNFTSSYCEHHEKIVYNTKELKRLEGLDKKDYKKALKTFLR